MQIARTALVAGLLSLTAFAFPVSAQSLTADDKAEMQISVDAFNTAFTNAEYDTIITSMPPKIKAFISEQANLSVEDLETAMIAQTEAALAAVTVETFAMNTDEASFGTTSEDRPYALIPTNTLMTIPDVGKVEGKSTTLALKDGGVWYLVRIEEQQQVELLLAVYPDFTGIDFPTGSVEIVE